MDTPCTVTVTRTSERDVKDRQVIVTLGGSQIALLRFGQSVTQEVEPGPNTLVVDNTWNKKSAEFELAPGAEARFQVINRPGRMTNFMVAVIGTGPLYVELERET
jgi:hypothetical protein